MGTQVGHCKLTGIATQLLPVLPSPGRAQPPPLGWQQQGQLLVASWQSSQCAFEVSAEPPLSSFTSAFGTF